MNFVMDRHDPDRKQCSTSAVVTVTFCDVAASFEEEDWGTLEEWQQELYRNAIKQIHGVLKDMGYKILNPEVLVKVEKSLNRCSTKDPCTIGNAMHVPDILLKIDQEKPFSVCDTVRKHQPQDFARGSRARKPEYPMKVKQDGDCYYSEAECDENGESPPYLELPLVVKKEEDRISRDVNDGRTEKEDEERHPRGNISLAPLIGPDGGGRFVFSQADLPSQYSVENSMELQRYLTHPALLLRDPQRPKRSEFDRGLYENYSMRSKQRLMLMGEKRYRCTDCGKGFTRNSHLKAHKRIHTGERPFKCNECEKTFSENSHLTVHLRVHSGEKRYKCSTCEKSFSENTNLVVHKRIHTGEKPYKCPECAMCFSQHSSLVRHRRKHSGARPYKCAQCEKTFSQKGHLSNHIRTHTGERPYKCNECGKCFSEHSHLTGHQKTHTGEKPYTCHLCHKSFSKISNLKAHHQIHTGYRPYMCSQCGKCFTQHSTLVRHQRVHTGKMGSFWGSMPADSTETNQDLIISKGPESAGK